MVEDQMKIEQEKQKMKKKEEKKQKKEQMLILGKGDARPKIGFSLNSSAWILSPPPSLTHKMLSVAVAPSTIPLLSPTFIADESVHKSCELNFWILWLKTFPLLHFISRIHFSLRRFFPLILSLIFRFSSFLVFVFWRSNSGDRSRALCLFRKQNGGVKICR